MSCLLGTVSELSTAPQGPDPRIAFRGTSDPSDRVGLRRCVVMPRAATGPARVALIVMSGHNPRGAQNKVYPSQVLQGHGSPSRGGHGAKGGGLGLQGSLFVGLFET